MGDTLAIWQSEKIWFDSVACYLHIDFVFHFALHVFGHGFAQIFMGFWLNFNPTSWELQEMDTHRKFDSKNSKDSGVVGEVPRAPCATAGPDKSVYRYIADDRFLLVIALGNRKTVKFVIFFYELTYL